MAVRAVSVLLAAFFIGGCGSAPPKRVDTAVAHGVRGATHVTFPSRDNDLTGRAPTELDGWLFRPEGEGPFPAVIALHGCAGPYAKGGNDLSSRHRDWSERLQSAGFVVFFPDSFSARGFLEICSQEKRTVRPELERARDAYGALVYLQAQPFVRADKIALLGWSNGAMTVLSTVAKDTEARPNGLKSDFRTAVAFYPGCRSTLKISDWKPVVPLHLLVGEKDDWTEAAPCKTLTDRTTEEGGSAPMDIVVYPDSFHDFDAPDMPIQTRHNVATTKSHTATVGTNPAARADAIKRVGKIMDEALAR